MRAQATRQLEPNTRIQFDFYLFWQQCFVNEQDGGREIDWKGCNCHLTDRKWRCPCWLDGRSGPEWFARLCSLRHGIHSFCSSHTWSAPNDVQCWSNHWEVAWWTEQTVWPRVWPVRAIVWWWIGDAIACNNADMCSSFAPKSPGRVRSIWFGTDGSQWLWYVELSLDCNPLRQAFHLWNLAILLSNLNLVQIFCLQKNSIDQFGDCREAERTNE